MEDLVLNVGQCKHLKKLGLDMSDAKMCWYNLYNYPEDLDSNDKWIAENKKEYWQLCKYPKNYKGSDIIPTYTLQEILEKLPRGMSWDTWNWELTHSGNEFQYNDGDGYSPFRIQEKGLLETAYEALCWVIEKGYLKSKKI